VGHEREKKQKRMMAVGVDVGRCCEMWARGYRSADHLRLFSVEVA